MEHVGKTGIFLLDGEYCFASYLVRVIFDPELVLPVFTNLMMNSDIFQSEAKAQASKSINQANISAGKLRNLTIPVPLLDEQKALVDTVSKLQAKIAKAETVVASCPARKEAILRKWLIDESAN